MNRSNYVSFDILLLVESYVNFSFLSGSSKMPLCPADESMSSGQIFPPDAVNPEATVGKIDHPITRGNVTDFARSV